jgi:SNF2 family DNA or RNA helicase
MPTLLEVEKKSGPSLRPDQLEVVDFVLSGDESIIVATTGFGKTAVMLHSIKGYVDTTEVRQAIIACPASVVSHWPAEAKKWGLDLDVVALTGNAEVRTRLILSQPDVLVVSLNNLDWLLQQKIPASMIIVDELTTACGKQTAKLRHKKWKDQINIRVGMTATPVSESYEKLFAMTRVVDNGARLGRSKEGFLAKYFFAADFKGYKQELKHDADKLILDALEDVLYIVESDKHLTLPPVVEHQIEFSMSSDALDAYTAMKTDMLIELTGGDAVAPNRAVASGKLRQIASGFVIMEDETVHNLDTNRANAAFDWIVSLGDKQGVVLYQYDHQRTQLEELLQSIGVVYVYGGCDKEAALTAFKNKEVQLLVAQERTVSHGVDGLQDVCSDLLFMSPPWSADTRIQAIGRLHRNGQTETVNISTLMARGSLDYLVEDRLATKAEHMKSFIKHLTEK